MYIDQFKQMKPINNSVEDDTPQKCVYLAYNGTIVLLKPCFNVHFI